MLHRVRSRGGSGPRREVAAAPPLHVVSARAAARLQHGSSRPPALELRVQLQAQAQMAYPCTGTPLPQRGFWRTRTACPGRSSGTTPRSPTCCTASQRSPPPPLPLTTARGGGGRAKREGAWNSVTFKATRELACAAARGPRPGLGEEPLHIREKTTLGFMFIRYRDRYLLCQVFGTVEWTAEAPTEETVRMKLLP